MKNKFLCLEEGFTLTEAVIAVFILSLGSFLLFFGGHRLYQSFNELREQNIFLTEVSQCSNLVSSTMNDIRFPYWENSPDIEPGTSEVNLTHLYGKKDSMLSLAFTDNGFTVSLEDENFIVFKSLKKGYIDTIEKEDTVVGLDVVLIDGKDRKYECKALFGSIPFLDSVSYEK